MTQTPTSRPPISAYIRTKNEARMIGVVVSAALKLAREVVVVDSGSTDETIMLAEQAGARVIHQDWLGNGFQKRVGEEACIHDWVLDLDADEIVSDEFAQEVGALFEGGAPDIDVFDTPLAIVPPVGKPWLNFGLASRRKLYDKTKHRARPQSVGPV